MNDKLLLRKRILAFIFDILIIAAADTVVFLPLAFSGIKNPAVYAIIAATTIMVYFVAFECSHSSATPGKNIFGIWVCYDVRRRIFLKTSLRFFLSVVTCLPLGMGFFRAVFSEDGKTIADLIIKSAVMIHKKENGFDKNPCVFKIENGVKTEYCIIGRNGVLMGRDSNVADITFPQDASGISRTHCSVRYNEQTELFILEDLCSSYGTYTESGEKVPPHKIKILENNEKFYLAQNSNMFCVGFKEELK